MRSTRIDITLFALALTLAGCQKEDLSHPILEQEVSERTFTAVTEGDGTDTKTVLSDDLRILWQKDDEVAVYEGQTIPSTYVVKKKNAGSTSAVLTLDEEASGTGTALDDNVAVYPASAAVSCSSTGSGYKVSVSMLSVQYYQESSFGAEAMPMVAVTDGTDDKSLQFKNVCGALKLSFKGNGYPVLKITIAGRNNEKISGSATLTCSNAALPTLSFGSSAGKTIVLDCGDGVLLNETTATDFIIPVPPVTFSNGLTATIETTNGNVTKTISSEVTVSRNKIKPFSEATLSGFFEITKLVDADGNEYAPLGLCGNHYSFCLPDGTDLTTLKAVFGGDASAVMIGSVPQTSGVTVNDFSSDVTYTVTVGGVDRDVIVSAYDFDLPALYIETPGQVAITSKEVWTGGTKTKLWNASDQSVTDLGLSEIKGRGNSTWSRPKKPYALKLGSKASILGMPSDKRWNLLANYIDRTMIRNAVALHIGQQTTGLAWTPHGEFVELIFNGVHQGNYFICEHIKVASNRVNIAEMTSDDVSGDAVTGGYIAEITIDDVEEFNTAVRNLPVNIKEPDEDVIQPAQIAYLSDYYSRFENILINKKAGDYRDYIDLDSFIDWWIVFELTMNHEPSNPKSCYMYKDRDDSENGIVNKLHAGPLWDFDWGTFVPSRASSYQIKGALYYPELFNDYYFVSRLKEKWLEYTTAGTFTAIGADNGFIDLVAESVRKSGIKNFEMWESSQTINGDEHDDFDTAIGKIKTSYNNKLTWLNTQITNMVVPPAPQPQEDKNGNTSSFEKEEENSW